MQFYPNIYRKLILNPIWCIQSCISWNWLFKPVHGTDHEYLNFSDIPIWKRLNAGIVPANKEYAAGTLSNVCRCWLAMPLCADVLTCTSYLQGLYLQRTSYLQVLYLQHTDFLQVLYLHITSSIIFIPTQHGLFEFLG